MDELTKTVDQIELQPVPGQGGIRAAILEGHPDRSGYYVIRLRFPAGVKSPPHHHDRDRFITVIDGTWHFGLGESGACDATRSLVAGSFAKHPAGTIHYDGSCGGPVTVEISGQGPVSTEYLGR